MKRSELIKCFESILNDYYPEYPDSNKFIATMFVDHAEIIGMLPPPTLKRSDGRFVSVEEASSMMLMLNEHISSVNEWEPE